MALNPDVKRLLQSPIMDPAEKQNNQVLTWDASLGKWIAKNGGGSGGASSLVDLDDVGIENPTDGQVIVYDSATQKWVNADAPTGGLTVIDMADYVTGGHIVSSGTTTLTNPGLISALTQAKAAGKPIVIKNIDLGWLLDSSDPTTWETERIIDPCVVQVTEIGTTIEVTLCLAEQYEYSFFVNDTGLSEELTIETTKLYNIATFTFPDTFDLTTGGNVGSQFWRYLGTLDDRVMFLKGLKITSDGSPINVLANFTLTTINPTLSRAGQFSFVYDSKIYIADWHVNNNAARDASVSLARII